MNISQQSETRSENIACKGKDYDLALVMPVYNEGECIRLVVNAWFTVLSSLKIRFKMLILNDGSKDNTQQELSSFDGNPNIKIINKHNSGHGPTILMGYSQAVQIADWVFQCDSDGEMEPESIIKLWKERNSFSALFGSRQGRAQSLPRKFITLVSRFVVKTFYGTGVGDVNTPYRLIRADILSKIISEIPLDTFAPNVIISACINKSRMPVYETNVPHSHRKTGVVSIVKWRLWKAAMRSFKQTIAFSIKWKGFQ